MVDLGTITWETFLTSIHQILKISDIISDCWSLGGTQETEGAAYIVKRTVQLNRPTETFPSNTQELVDLEEALESVLEDKSCGKVTDRTNTLTKEYHVLYSPSYSVPVLYFNAWKSDGKLLNLEETWESVHSSLKPRLERDKWQTLTQTEHPILRRPFYQLHPCGTARLLECFAGSSGNPVVTWLSSVGPAVGLELRGEYSALTAYTNVTFSHARRSEM